MHITNEYGHRLHKTPIGLVPGVTTVLSNTKSEYTTKSLNAWKVRVGYEEADRIQSEAIVRGNRLHSYVENYLQGKPFLEYELHKVVTPLLESISEAVLIEEQVWCPSGYAGSLDLLARIKKQYVLIDWKTSRKPKKRNYIYDYLYQVAAYCKAVEYTKGIKVRKGLVAIAVEHDNPETGVVERYLQEFKITEKQLENYFVKFQQRLAEYQELYGGLI